MADPTTRFDLVYDRHYRDVLAYCMRRTEPADARAAANRVMEIAWRKLDDLPSGDETLPWLYGVARKVLGHHWRGIRRRRRLENELRAQRGRTQVDPGQVVVMREELEHVLEASALLNDRDREILRLAGWEGLSHRQIADILGCSVATVDQRFHRAKRRLAEKYDTVTHARTLRRVVGLDNPGGAR